MIHSAFVFAILSTTPAGAVVTCSGTEGNVYCSDGAYTESVNGSTFGKGPDESRGWTPPPLSPDPQLNGSVRCQVSPSSEGCE